MAVTAALGLRLAFHRENLARLVVLAAWAALSVLVVVFSLAVPRVFSYSTTVTNDRLYAEIPGTAKAPIDDPVAGTTYTSMFRGRQLELVLLERAPDTAPPGVTEMPGPGQAVVSPALAEILADAALATELRQRVPGEVIGTIGDAGLTGPDELFAYVGVAQVPAPASTLTGWGRRAGLVTTEDLPSSVTGAFAAALVVPLLGLFIAGAGFGSRRRQALVRRLELLGAPSSSTATVVIAEAVVPVGIGAAIGAALVAPVGALAAGAFPADVRPFAWLVNSPPTEDWLRTMAVVAIMVVVGGIISARNRPSKPTPKRLSRARAILWPTLFVASLVASLAISAGEVDGGTIFGLAATVTALAFMALRPTVDGLALVLARARRGVAGDLAVARLRYAGSAMLWGARGIIASLIVVLLGLGIIRVVDAATTVGDVVWDPSIVADDTVFVSAPPERSAEIAAAVDGVRVLRQGGSVVDASQRPSGPDRSVVVVECGGEHHLTPQLAAPQACPHAVVTPDSSLVDLTSATVTVAGVELDDVGVAVAPFTAPAQFLGDTDAAVVYVDAPTFARIDAAPGGPSSLRSLVVGAVGGPDRDQRIEALRESLAGSSALPFSGGRSSLDPVVTKADLLIDSTYYERLYGTLIMLICVIVVVVFALAAVFGAMADVGDGRDQSERLDLLGADPRLVAGAQRLRSFVPVAAAVAVGTVAGATLGVSYCRLSGYTDVLPGIIAGYPVAGATVAAAAAAALLWAATVFAIRTTRVADPLGRLRDR